MAESAQKTYQRGLTLRSFVICVVALFLMGVWIEYEELYCVGGPFAENSPPNGAVGVIWIVLIIGGILYKLRRTLRIVPAELVVVYSALVLAAPLMTQGMWHRIFGLMGAIPYSQDFKSYESLPSMLWPHGENLCRNGQFRKGTEGFQHSGGGQLSWVDVDRKAKGIWKSPKLTNAGASGAKAMLTCTIRRLDESGKECLVPGENFLFSALVKAESFAKGSSYFVNIQPDSGAAVPILVNAESTKATFSNPEGFRRVGVSPVTIPRDLKEKLTLQIGISGDGSITLQDIQFMNVEAIAGAYMGRNVVRESELSKLDASERNFMVVKPDNMLSLAGLRYLMTGYIPLRQWAQPLMAWGLLIGGLFIGFLGLNILMRKQWAENERFTFPLTILPKNLFAEAEDGEGGLLRPILWNRVTWIGFAVMLPLVVAKGLKFYYPDFPSPPTTAITLDQYVNSPLLKAFLTNVGIGRDILFTMSFCVLAIAMLIETDILFSLWASFLIFQLWFLFGRAFNFNRFPGYPWDQQQQMGGFIAYALLALFIGRHHLLKVLRHVVGAGGKDEGLDQAQEVTSYRTAILMVAGSMILIVWWSLWTQMGAVAGLLFFGYMLVCGFAASKIRAECGAPFGYLTPYFGMQFVAAVGGFAVFKTTGMLVATIASGFMCTALFLLIAPVQVEMMELGRHFRVRPRDIGAGLTLGLAGGLLIGCFVLLCWAYGFGANNMKQGWPYPEHQSWYFDGFRGGELNADRAFEAGTPGATPETRPLNFVSNPDAKGMGMGIVFTLVLAFLRSKFVWFPFHPIGYVLAPSYFMKGVFYAVFISWVVRMIVFRVGGARTIRHGLVPFCVGMFMSCIASIVIFDIVSICLRMRGAVSVYAGIP